MKYLDIYLTLNKEIKPQELSSQLCNKVDLDVSTALCNMLKRDELKATKAFQKPNTKRRRDLRHKTILFFNCHLVR